MHARMTLSRELEAAIEKAETLPYDEQRRIAAVMVGMIAKATPGDMSGSDQKACAYRADIERALNEAQGERLPGRLSYSKDIERRIKAMYSKTT